MSAQTLHSVTSEVLEFNAICCVVIDHSTQGCSVICKIDVIAIYMP